jgi:hypothetical protein
MEEKSKGRRRNPDESGLRKLRRNKVACKFTAYNRRNPFAFGTCPSGTSGLRKTLGEMLPVFKKEDGGERQEERKPEK